MKFPQRFFHRAFVNVPVEVAWDVFTDHERMGEYTGSPCRIKTDGEPERRGLGCVRVVGVAEHGMPEVEEVVNYWAPNKLFGYHVISGAPITHHQGIVRFWARGDRQTEWVYDMRLVATDEVLQSTPEFYDLLISDFRTFMKDAECECERRGAAVGVDVPSEPIPLTVQGGQLG